MRREVSPKFHLKNGVKNGKFHANFTLLGRSADVLQHSVPRRVLRRFWTGFWGRVLRRVLRRGSAMCFSVEKGSEKGSQKGSEKAASRRCLELPLVEYAPLGVRPTLRPRNRKSKSLNPVLEVI